MKRLVNYLAENTTRKVLFDLFMLAVAIAALFVAVRYSNFFWVGV